MQPVTKPKVLFVYYTFTKQALKVTEDMESVFRERGWDITRAQIEFTDARYKDRFEQFPLKHRYLDIIRLLPAQLRRATGEIRIPPEAESGDYDLVCIGSPTWWLTTCMPIRSYLESDEAGRLLKEKSVAGAKPISSTSADRSGRCSRSSATSERASTASGTSGSRSRPPTSSPTVTTRPEPSPANSPTISRPPPQHNERGKDGLPRGRHRKPRVGSS